MSIQEVPRLVINTRTKSTQLDILANHSGALKRVVEEPVAPLIDSRKLESEIKAGRYGMASWAISSIETKVCGIGLTWFDFDFRQLKSIKFVSWNDLGRGHKMIKR